MVARTRGTKLLNFGASGRVKRITSVEAPGDTANMHRCMKKPLKYGLQDTVLLVRVEGPSHNVLELLELFNKVLTPIIKNVSPLAFSKLMFEDIRKLYPV